jgi:hypothetical protein
MQTMLRMVGFGDNAGSGFPAILSAWEKEGWIKPVLEEDTATGDERGFTLKCHMNKHK